MNVTYFHQYFKIDSGGTRSYEFSKHLVENGIKVTMITGSKGANQFVDGIKVESTNTVYRQDFSFYRRIYAFIHFMIKSTIIGLRQKNTDIIYATSTPLTIGIPALLVSKFKRKKYIFEVRDVWPDIPIELGFIKSKIVKRALYFFEMVIYKYASHIVVLSEGMKANLMKKGVNEDKITVITNLSMNYLIDEIEHEGRKFYEDKMLCIHPGTMGYVNGLDFLLDLAKEYYDEDIIYLLIGEGNQKKRLIERIQRESIKNVIIKDSIPKNEVLRKIKQSDVGIMLVENHEILQDNSANKFFDFLATGLPIVINYEGWQKEVLERNNAGRAFKYKDKKGFYSFLVELKNDKYLRDTMAKNAKKLAMNKYDSEILSKQFQDLLFKIAKD